MYNATVRFLKKEEGGRTNPPLSGYKPQIGLGGVSTSCFVYLQNEENEVMDLGVDHNVSIKLQFDELYKDYVHTGLNFGLFEGSRLIGKGSFCSC